MTDKYRYMIFPDRTYVLTYEDMTYEVSGETILAMFHREAHNYRLIQDWIVSDTPELFTDADYIDIGEL
jgi:hypothetical protein